MEPADWVLVNRESTSIYPASSNPHGCWLSESLLHLRQSPHGREYQAHPGAFRMPRLGGSAQSHLAEDPTELRVSPSVLWGIWKGGDKAMPLPPSYVLFIFLGEGQEKGNEASWVRFQERGTGGNLEPMWLSSSLFCGNENNIWTSHCLGTGWSGKHACSPRLQRDPSGSPSRVGAWEGPCCTERSPWHLTPNHGSLLGGGGFTVTLKFLQEPLWFAFTWIHFLSSCSVFDMIPQCLGTGKAMMSYLNYSWWL